MLRCDVRPAGAHPQSTATGREVGGGGGRGVGGEGICFPNIPLYALCARREASAANPAQLSVVVDGPEQATVTCAYQEAGFVMALPCASATTCGSWHLARTALLIVRT